MTTTESSTVDVVVVGAGLAGLTAAATAARAGATTLVLDARDHLGGRARTHHEHGFALNQGAHALYTGMPGARVLAELGVVARGGRPPARGWVRHDGRLERLPATPLDTVRSRVLGVRETLRAARLLGRPRALLASPTEGRSMAEWIAEHAGTGELGTFATMITRVATYIDDPAEIDAGAALANLVSAATDGVQYLDGGWDQLVEALRATARAAGAEVSAGARVEAVERTASGWTVHASDRGWAARSVVLASGGPGHAAALLGGASEAVAGWAEELRPVLASSLDLALDGLPVPSHRFVLASDAPLYLSVHTPTAALAPPTGGEVVHLLRYGGADDARAELEGLLDQAQPGWRSRVVAERYGRRLVVAHGRPEPGTGLAGRPGPVVPDAPGLLVAGDWVGGEGLLADASLASGARAGVLAAHAVRHAGVAA